MAGESMEVEVRASLENFQKGFQQGIQTLERFAQKAKESSKPLDDFATRGGAWSSFMRTMGNNSKEASNNLRILTMQGGDFVTMIAGGMSPLRAFSSQIGQVAGVFKGPWLIAAGIAATALAPLIENMLTATEKAKPLKEAISSLKGTISDYNKSLADVKAAMNDTGWENSNFALMVKQAQEALAKLDLVKVKNEFASIADSIAGTFGGALTTMQSVDFTLGRLGNSLSGVNRAFLIGVNGIKLGFRGVIDITNKAGENFAVMTTGLRNMGVEADVAARLSKNLIDALNSGDMQSIATAAKAMAAEIERVGTAAGGATPLQRELAAALQSLITQAGGVQKSMDGATGSIRATGNAAVVAAGQVAQLVAAMAGLSGLPATINNLWTGFQGSKWVAPATKLVGDFNANLKAMPDLIKRAEGVKNLADPMREYNASLAENQKLLAAGLITQDEYEASVKKLNETLAGTGKGGGGGGGGRGGGGTADKVKKLGEAVKGAGKAMEEAKKPLEDFAKGLADIAQNAITGLVDSLFAVAEGSKTMKEAAVDALKSILKQVTQLIVQMLILKPLMGALGGPIAGLFGGGASPMSLTVRGIGPSLQTVPKNALGNYNGFSQGVAMSPGAMQAMMRSSVAASGSTTHVAPMTVNVHNNVGAKIRTENDGKMLQIYIDAAVEAVSSELHRGGGKIAAGLERGYGVRRVGY